MRAEKRSDDVSETDNAYELKKVSDERREMTGNVYELKTVSDGVSNECELKKAPDDGLRTRTAKSDGLRTRAETSVNRRE
jgi:hypothetical protein